MSGNGRTVRTLILIPAGVSSGGCVAMLAPVSCRVSEVNVGLEVWVTVVFCVPHIYVYIRALCFRTLNKYVSHIGH